MKRGELINRGIAAVSTLAFMALVRPDPDVSRVGLTVTAILMYEALRISIGFIRKERRKRKVKKNTDAMLYDGTRWANEWLRWPIREVS